MRVLNGVKAAITTFSIFLMMLSVSPSFCAIFASTMVTLALAKRGVMSPCSRSHRADPEILLDSSEGEEVAVMVVWASKVAGS